MNAKIGTSIKITNENCCNFTGVENFNIKNIEEYLLDEQSIMEIYEIDNYYLVKSKITDTMKLYFCEWYDSGCEYYDYDEDEFPETIKLVGGESKTVYRLIDEPTYSNDENLTPSLAEYRSKKYFKYMLVTKQNDDINLYRGFRIPNKSVHLIK